MIHAASWIALNCQIFFEKHEYGCRRFKIFHLVN